MFGCDFTEQSQIDQSLATDNLKVFAQFMVTLDCFKIAWMQRTDRYVCKYGTAKNYHGLLYKCVRKWSSVNKCMWHSIIK